MKTLTTLLLSFCIAMSSCDISQSAEASNSEASAVAEVLDLKDKGYELLKSNCYACHNPNTESHDVILAPPFAAVKMRYQRRYNNREDFVNGVSRFVANPSKESAMMRGAVGRFGVMPKPILAESDIQLIAEYIYDNKLEEPDWFAEHSKEMHGD